MSSIKNCISVFSGFLETLFFGAIIYGWSSLNFVLIKDGYFNSSCNNSFQTSNTSLSLICSEQHYQLGLVFTLAAAIPPGLCIVVGKVLDLYGTWVVRFINSVLVFLSCIAIAFSSSSTSWILYPATIAINLCGYTILITNEQLANLFPNNRGLVINLINGALNASLIMFTFVKIAYEHGYPLKWSFLLMSVLGPLMIIRTFLLMPKNKIPFDIPIDYYYGINECCNNNSCLSEETSLLHTTNQSEDEVEKVVPTNQNKTHLLSFTYLFGIYSFSIQILTLNFFVESLNLRLFPLFSHSSSDISYSLSVFGYFQLISLIFAPIIGLQVDFLRQKFENLNYTRNQAQLLVLAIQNIFASFALILFVLLSIFLSNSIIYVSYLLFIFIENFAYSNLGLFILQCFPIDHFGTLYGLALLASAIVTTFQFPLYFVAIHYFHNQFLVVNVILLILSLLTVIHPIDLYKRSKQ